MGSLMGLRMTRRTPLTVQPRLNPQWSQKLAFLCAPGLGWWSYGAPVSPPVAGTYGSGNYGKDWKPGSDTAAGAGTFTNCALGNNYTLFSVQRCGSGAYQSVIDDDNGTGARHFQHRISSANAVQLIAFNTTPSAFTVTGGAVSVADRLCGFPMAATVSSGGALAVWYRGAKTTGTATGTVSSASNPRIGSNKADAQALLSGLALAVGWSYILSDSQIRSLMANPMQVFE